MPRLVLLAVFLASSLMGRTIQQSLRWDQLAPVVAGQKVGVELINGKKAEGVVVSVGPEALVLQMGPSAQKNNKTGQSAIPRSEIRSLRVSGGETAARWWGLFFGSGIGLAIGGGVFRGPCTSGFLGNSCGPRSGADWGAAAGIGGGMGLVGFLTGKRVGHWETRILLLPDRTDAGAGK